MLPILSNLFEPKVRINLFQYHGIYLELGSLICYLTINDDMCVGNFAVKAVKD